MGIGSCLHRLAALIGISMMGLAGCNGSGDEGGNTPPEPVITSPADGAQFRAGDTLTFTASARDAQDGALAAGSMTWWVEFHHDTHAHPFVQPSAGASGTVTVPTRGETSDNIWLRFHLRATDSSGLSSEVTRDVGPHKAQFSLATQPAGLSLTLDGQPFAGARTVTGVVGLERDIGAADQVLNGRSYRFSNWNDGGPASHTILTPATNRTFIATFIDGGPAVNQPPSVALAAPANGSAGTVGVPITLTATASDGDGSVASVQFFDGSVPIGDVDTMAPFSVIWTPAAAGAHSLTARAVDDRGGTANSATIVVTVNLAAGDVQPPTVRITAPAPFADNLSGTVAISADASDNVGVASVEFQIDGVPLVADTSSPYGAALDTTVHAAGQHVLRARASDAAGNVSAWTSVTVRFGGTRSAPAGIAQNNGWVTGLTNSTALTQLPDGRILVAQIGGTLLVVQTDGTRLATPMLTLPVPQNYSERGLLGVTAHPAFASNGFIYVYYTTRENGFHNRISRFTVSGNTAAGEVILADLPPVTSFIHNGGGMHFGPDGKLYVSVGDDAVSTNAQDLNTPLGKILRLNDDGSIPADNPFCTTQGNLACAVWAYGLRSPFTFAFQPGTGRMHINDVGSAIWEEINVGARGANYGWPQTEGPTSASGIAAPLFAYGHNDASPPGSGPGGFFVGICVIGGDFYPSNGPFPAPWRGGYFFTDFGTGFIGFMDLQNDNAVYAFGSLPVNGIGPVGLMVAKDGALLVLTRQAIVRFAVQ